MADQPVLPDASVEIDLLRMTFSVEELGVALGMMNYMAAAGRMIDGSLADLGEEQLSQRLGAAGNALVARGAASFTPSGVLELPDYIEQMLFPLGEYDYVLHLLVQQSAPQIDSDIYVQRGQAFTSALRTAPPIRLVEHGRVDHLPGLIASLLPDFGGEETSAEQKMLVGVLDQVLNTDSADEIAPLLTNLGWADDLAWALAEDVQQPRLHATLTRLDADHTIDPDHAAQIPTPALVCLQGPAYSWLFEFPSADQMAAGTSMIISRADFEEIVAEFVL